MRKSISRRRMTRCIPLAVLCHGAFVGTALVISPSKGLWSNPHRLSSSLVIQPNAYSTGLSSSASSDETSLSSSSTANTSNETEKNLDKNNRYIQVLMENLQSVLDKYILTGSPATKESAYNVLNMIKEQAVDPEWLLKATRLVQRAGLPPEKPEDRQDRANTVPQVSKVELGKTDEQRRAQQAEERQKWEAARQSTGKEVAENARSALSQRTKTNGKPDLFLGNIDSNLDPRAIANDKVALQKELSTPPSVPNVADTLPKYSNSAKPAIFASAKVSELVAQAGSGTAFEGQRLGIGGLDDVLSEVKRRIWTPLAAPPQLLRELGIHPVRGLLLYGKPGCGKTLLASKLGRILSPIRPITVVSGPEIMDKFVGSSEKNLRDIFDNPPDIYDFYRIGESDGGDALAKAALHVVIMDEFDAIARTRGGRGGSGNQGDAGVARDSVVNQLLAKMDGVDPLKVPTMVIGLTNKRSLVDPALLRPGRFEVQVEVPAPRTVEQRVSILNVHCRNMHQAGRLLVRDAPAGTAAARMADDSLPTYNELLTSLAKTCAGFSGASLAGVARAAASHALERAVEEFTQTHKGDGSLLRDCVVTRDDFESAVQDVLNSLGDSDWSEDSSEVENANVDGSEVAAEEKKSPE